ncbi:orotate phosphoribosyltransferase [Mucisphaera calidilacus]|uniref:Orotate phosphoribosyltransferase n=1 Tax=Mucisphaera calidilacus TaxID=2527982 RepID=A0A518C0G0_9BACT|nr:orotate phosphoribosyltransferase [Mucisphaera calidilacus]QDU72703.1 Orotate phosphoribosyltransferase [Mucisphaera calidilacus]
MNTEELITRIREAALLEGEFTLRSGKTSRYYLDKYLFETDPVILREVGRRLAERVRGFEDVTRVAGAELGGIPLVVSVSLELGIPSLLIRNQKKDYGTAKQFEGRLEAGDRIVLLEDVATTGGQALEAARLLRDECDAEVLAVIAILDREEGARENLEGAGFVFDALFERADMRMD